MDCAPTPSTLAQSKEGKESNFAIWQPCFKVVLPLVEKYFSHHRSYFTAQATISNAAGVATIKEKESVAALFCKLASLLRDACCCVLALLICTYREER